LAPAWRNPVGALHVLPDGDLVAGNSQGLWRWDGVQWTSFSTGPAGAKSPLVMLPNGELLVGGVQQFGAQQVPYLARVTTTCPASATSFGSGCVGSGGLNRYEARTLPWLGATFRGEALGLPAASFVAVVSGFTSVAIPLSLVFGGAPAGCEGLVAPDAVEILLPTAGRVQTQLAIPDVPALVGLQLHQYAFAFEVLPGGAFGPITSTNALTLRLGAF
jgi:hypothetical protein